MRRLRLVPGGGALACFWSTPTAVAWIEAGQAIPFTSGNCEED
jgi:hypothetical protein